MMDAVLQEIRECIVYFLLNYVVCLTVFGIEII